MPEFLPNPNYEYRDKVRERLERMDMYRRRAEITLPEFYVGEALKYIYRNT
jgi:large subunit ribosomal protein L19